MKLQIKLPEGAEHIISKLNRAGFEAYIVGGCVRDSLMGKKPSDWDICTSATTDEMLEVFNHKRVIPTGIQHGTLTILEKDAAYEVTTFRIDGDYIDHRRPEQVYFTRELAEDLGRRDFTINAMAWHPEMGLIDLYQGEEDLKNRVVRAVGEPMERFNEDGLRMLRMVRFATVLDFDYDDKTWEAACRLVYLLNHISKERIQVELNKTLMADHPARGLADLYDLGMYPYIVPMMCHEVGFAQEGGHHFLDVFEHSILSTGLVPKDLVLRLTMMLHDIGKPFTWVEMNEYDDFPAHAEVGAKLANQILRNLKYDNDTRKRVVELIAHHNDILLDDEVILRKSLSVLGSEQLERLIRVKVADLIAHDLGENRKRMCDIFIAIETSMRQIIERGDPVKISDLAIGGKDVMALGYRGTEIGAVLNEVLQQVLQTPEMNTKENLIRYITERES